MKYHDKNMHASFYRRGLLQENNVETLTTRVEQAEYETWQTTDARLNVYPSRRVTRFPPFIVPPPPYFERHSSVIHFIMSANQPIDYLTLIGHVEELGVPVFDFVNHLTKG